MLLHRARDSMHIAPDRSGIGERGYILDALWRDQLEEWLSEEVSKCDGHDPDVERHHCGDHVEQ